MLAISASATIAQLIYPRSPDVHEPDKLASEDKKERREWAEAHRPRGAGQRDRFVHAIIDNMVVSMCSRGKFRAAAAKRQVRGAYRARWCVFSMGHAKPANPNIMNNNAGVQSVTALRAIGNGRVLMRHALHGRWNANAARNMYAGSLGAALQLA